MNGGGALAALILGMVVSQLWARGQPALLAKRADPHYAHNAEFFVGTFWRLIAQPLLFGLAGSGVVASSSCVAGLTLAAVMYCHA